MVAVFGHNRSLAKVRGLANDLEPMVLPIQSMLGKKHPEAFGHMFMFRHLSDRSQIRPKNFTYDLKIWDKKF